MTPKETVRAYVEAFNAADWGRMAELFTPDAEILGVLGTAPIATALNIWRELHAGMGERLQIEALVEEGPHVVARLRERGRFVGPFRGLPGVEPTGKAYEIPAMEWFEFRDGRIARRWGARDSAAMLRQIKP